MSVKREELSSTKWGNVVTGKKLEPVHPGEILLHDFIEPMGLTRYRVAKSISVPQRRIDEICASNRAVTADTAMRLARLFGMDAQTWMNLQSQYDLEVAEQELGDKIDHEVVPLAA
jgi:addiction module HigA family antidote